MFATRWGLELQGQNGGSGGVDDSFARRYFQGVGAEIMGAGKFGHPGWHEDPEWKGAWGPNPPFHTPVFVLTHHTRPSIEMEGGTTYHFIDASPAEALETAREAAHGKDVRIGVGPTMIRDFVAAGLVDHMHVVVVPILLGRGVSLWTDSTSRCCTASSPTWWGQKSARSWYVVRPSRMVSDPSSAAATSLIIASSTIGKCISCGASITPSREMFSYQTTHEALALEAA